MPRYLRIALFTAFILHSNLSWSQTWTLRDSIPNTPGGGRWSPMCFSLNGKVYLGGGYEGNFNSLNDFWEYDPSTDTWEPKADLPGSVNRTAGVAFAGNGKGYVGLGSVHYNTFNADFLNDLWEYDPTTDQWTQKASLPDSGRHEAASFVVGQKAYVVGGNTDYPYIASNDLWEYDMVNNTWTSKAAYPASFIHGAMAFAIGQSGYVVGGRVKNSGSSQEGFADSATFEYNTLTNTWSQKANYCGPRESGVGFALSGTGYVGLGTAQVGAITFYYEEFCSYDPVADQWTTSLSYPHIARAYSAAAVVVNSAFVGAGWLYTGSEIYQSDWAEWSVEASGVQGTIPQPLSIFPNPAQEMVFVRGALGQTLSLRDLQGRSLIESFHSETDMVGLDVSEVPAGTYLIECSGTHGKTSRLIVVH